MDVTPTNVETMDRRLYGYSKQYTYEITISKSSTVYIEFQDTVKYDELGKYKVISFRCQDRNVEIPSGYELVSGRPASRYVYLTNEGIPDKYTIKGYGALMTIEASIIVTCALIGLIPVIKIPTYIVCKSKEKKETE